jgi:hypothetical protein
MGPSARSEVAMAWDAARGQAVLFSGSNGEALVDTWTWDGALWTQAGDTGPSQRQAPGMAYDHAAGAVLLFGGFMDAFFGDTWAWEGAGWTQVADTGPSPRSGVAMAADPVRKVIVLFGGGKGAQAYADTWEWDGQAWTQIADAGPPPASGAQMAYDAASAAMLMVNRDGQTWSWDGAAWTQVADTGPGPRFGYRLTSAGGGVVLFGGEAVVQGAADLSTLSNQTWAWTGQGWREVQDMGPPPRALFGLVEDGDGHLVLFGGQGQHAQFGDTWTLQPPKG